MFGQNDECSSAAFDSSLHLDFISWLWMQWRLPDWIDPDRPQHEFDHLSPWMRLEIARSASWGSLFQPLVPTVSFFQSLLKALSHVRVKCRWSGKWRSSPSGSAPTSLWRSNTTDILWLMLQQIARPSHAPFSHHWWTRNPDNWSMLPGAATLLQPKGKGNISCKSKTSKTQTLTYTWEAAKLKMCEIALPGLTGLLKQLRRCLLSAVTNKTKWFPITGEHGPDGAHDHRNVWKITPVNS